MNDAPENEANVNPNEPTTGGADNPHQFFASLASQSSEDENDRLMPPGQRACPICGALMQTCARDAIRIDVCPDHGTWLDNGKLEAIAANTSVSSMRKHRRDIEKARTRGKLKGTLFGWLSFFMD